MKALALTLLALACAGCLNAQTLQRAEKLTDAEKVQRAEARQKVANAQAELETVEAKIAGAHGMGKESWMEWSRWYEFDGEFILQRSSSMMVNRTTSGSVTAPGAIIKLAPQ
jgi:outer membrane lipoprotein-sorting protein